MHAYTLQDLGASSPAFLPISQSQALPLSVLYVIFYMFSSEGLSNTTYSFILEEEVSNRLNIHKSFIP